MAPQRCNGCWLQGTAAPQKGTGYLIHGHPQPDVLASKTCWDLKFCDNVKNWPSHKEKEENSN